MSGARQPVAGKSIFSWECQTPSWKPELNSQRQNRILRQCILCSINHPLTCLRLGDSVTLRTPYLRNRPLPLEAHYLSAGTHQNFRGPPGGHFLAWRVLQPRTFSTRAKSDPPVLGSSPARFHFTSLQLHPSLVIRSRSRPHVYRLSSAQLHNGRNS